MTCTASRSGILSACQSLLLKMLLGKLSVNHCRSFIGKFYGAVNSILHVLGSSDQVAILTSESEFDHYIAAGGRRDL